MLPQPVNQPAAGPSAVDRLRGTHSTLFYFFLLQSLTATDKPLKDWTNQELIDWAKKVYRHVAAIVEKEQYDGSTLAGWEKADFKEYLNGAHGAAFYGHLLGAYFLSNVPFTHNFTEHGKITPAGTPPIICFCALLPCTHSSCQYLVCLPLMHTTLLHFSAFISGVCRGCRVPLYCCCCFCVILLAYYSHCPAATSSTSQDGARPGACSFNCVFKYWGAGHV